MGKASKKILYKGKIFTVILENVKLPKTNKTTNFEYVKHQGSIAIVPLIDKNKIILLKQYRHAIRDYIYEIPAGRIEKNETIRNSAKRELIEEIGYEPQKLVKLTSIFLAPGYSTEKIHIFLATDLIKKKQKLESDEIITLKEVTIEEGINLIKQGKIIDAKTIAGILLFWMKNYCH